MQGGGGGQGGCERRSEVFVNIQKRNSGGGVWSGEVRVDVNEELKFLWKLKKNRGRVVGRMGGGQGGCDRRIEVIAEMQKKNRGGGGGQVLPGEGGVRSGRGWGVEGWGLVDRDGVGW